MRHILSIVPAALLLTACATAGTRVMHPASADFQPSSDGGVGRERIHNTTLERITLDEGRTPLLLVIRHEWWVNPEEEEHGGRVKASALGWDGRAFTRPVWTMEGPADEWQTDWIDYLRLTQYGCCDIDNTHTIHDMRTGRAVAWFTEEPLTAYGVDGSPVLVAYESPKSTRVPDGFDGEGVQGMLRIVRGAAVTDSIVVTGGGEGETGYMHPRGAWCGEDGTVRMRQPDGMGPESVFRVCYQFENDAWAVLPVRDGRFLLEDARFPAGISARRGGWVAR